MRLSSVVSLVLGAIAIVVGIVLCNAAEADAIANGYNLYEPIYDESGNIEKEFSFSHDDDINVSKVEIELEGANVYVIGGAEKSKIVVRNMYAGTYSCNISNKVATITNVMDMSTLVDAAQGIEFNGIRQFFNFENFKKRQPEVYIYLNYTNEPIKQISFDVKDCIVNVSNIEGSLDLRIDAENSNMAFSDFITDSGIDCELVNSDVTFTNVDFLNANIEGEGGSFTFDSELIVLYRITAATVGTIKANGETFQDSYKINENQQDYPTMNITFTSGDIVLDFIN